MRIPRSQFKKESQELKAIEKELRAKALIFRPDVKGLLKTANSAFSQAIYDSLTNRLRPILESHETECIRKPDEFRPYGPEQLLSQGDFCLMGQMDDVRFMIEPDKLLTGVLVLGPQGSGKSRFIIKLCNESSRVKPNVKITIVDPKNGFSNLPNFRHIDLSKASLDLTSPSNTNQNNFVYEFMPILASACSLIYGLDFLNQAVDIVYSQLQQYAKQTGEDTSLGCGFIFWRDVSLCVQ